MKLGQFVLDLNMPTHLLVASNNLQEVGYVNSG